MRLTLIIVAATVAALAASEALGRAAARRTRGYHA